jgi:DNA-binding MarR family transcriptional regulator
MDEIDEDVLTALIDGKPHTFQQILQKISFTHNTLRLHLDRLVDQKLVTREKAKRTGRGRPIYLYSLGSGGRKAALMLRSGVEGVVSLPFVGLGQVCRFEKGGFCKKVRMGCEARNCPQISKWV